MSQSYLDEIREQPGALRRLSSQMSGDFSQQLEEIRTAIDAGAIDHLIITGMGGSLYSAYGTWLRLSDRLPIPVSLWDASELMQQAPGLLRSKTAVIAISQSGESVELRRLAETNVGPYRISLTNSLENTLSRWSMVAVATQVGPERTVSTKTYTAGLAALYAIEAGLLGGLTEALIQIERVGIAAEQVLAGVAGSTDRILKFIGYRDPIAFIGRGASFSSASMAALVTAEAAKAHTVALSGGQFRHGPLELVRAGFVSVLFMGDDATRPLNLRTVADIVGFGGKCLVIDPRPTAGADGAGAMTLALPEVAPALLPILEILPIQLLMVPMAAARGFEPAQFLNGSKVTAIE